MAREEDKSSALNGVKNIFDDYNKRMTMSNHPDPSSRRNIGRNGELERTDQKDRLENLRIHGNEATGYGGNNPNSTEEFAQGPGFEFEGSETAMSGSTNGIRSSEQELNDENAEARPRNWTKGRGKDRI